MKMFIANWKMNQNFDSIDKWLDQFYQNYNTYYEKLKDDELVFCPPSVYIDYVDSELTEEGFKFLEHIAEKDNRDTKDFTPEEVSQIVFGTRPIRIGAQDCHHEDYGSYTGDVSANMLKTVGCEYVILGHSERRINYLETSGTISKKIRSAIKNNLTPIICVGETKRIRQEKQHLDFVKQQIISSIPSDVKFDKLIIAYEPVWSVGTGLVASSEEIKEMLNFIKNLVEEKFKNNFDKCFLLYGGSVNSDNSAEILSIEEISGLLIGKSSLDAVEFLKISSS